MKKILFHEILPLTQKYGITRHLVVTVKGKEYRDTHTPEQSYIDSKKAFKKLIQAIRFQYGNDFIYIAFWRAQRTGYCHIHLLINKYIDLEWLIEKVSKYKVFGNINITWSKDATHYLINDFYKDHEWYTPKKQRRHTNSKCLHLQKNKHDSTDKIVYVKPTYSSDPEIRKYQRIRFYGKIAKKIEQQTGTTVPNEFIYKQFEETVPEGDDT